MEQARTQLGRVIQVAILLMALAGMMIAAPGSATAAEAMTTPADYAGRTIDLAEDWEGAQACAVWAADDVRCYDTTADMVAAEKAASGTSEVSLLALSDCPSGVFTNEWFCLFENANHTGRMLKFKEANICQNLNNFDFSNKASSWANTLGRLRQGLRQPELRVDRAPLHREPALELHNHRR